MPFVNRLIDGLPRKDRYRILERSERVDLAVGAILCQTAQPLSQVYFPLTGFISTLGRVAGHPPLEMGLIGNEGMLGITLMLEVDTVPLRAVVQGPGTALRMTAAQFRRELRDSPSFHRMLNHYLFVLLAQLSQTAACNRFHGVKARLARSLLKMHDRAYADHFHLTQKFLAEMLGVRRSSVSIAAGALQRRSLISCRRGEISILNRKGLEAASCECYRAEVEDYAELFPQRA